MITKRPGKPSKLTEIANQHSQMRQDFLSRKSMDWLKQQVSILRNPARMAQAIAKEKHRNRGRTILGGLYFFFYDPKYAKTLPYYDTFPLVLVLERYKDGFLGLNLHYLPVNWRAAFLDQLMVLAQLDDQDDPKRIRITYDILNSTRRYKAFRPCLKRYLTNQMGSRALLIEPHEWETALFLPVEQFKKRNKATVQRESVQAIKQHELESKLANQPLTNVTKVADGNKND